jgi:hypothetical protein
MKDLKKQLDAIAEGKLHELSIGDIKEVMKEYNEMLNLSDVVKIWLAYNE